MLPREFLDRMQQMLGDEYETFFSTFEQEKHQALRLNALKTGFDGRCATDIQREQENCDINVRSEALLSAGKNSVSFLHLSRVPWAENGYYYEATDQPG